MVAPDARLKAALSLKHGDRAALAVQSDIGKLTLALGLLEDGHADQPDFDDAFRYGAVDPLRVVGIEIALLRQPLADVF